MLTLRELGAWGLVKGDPHCPVGIPNLEISKILIA